MEAESRPVLHCLIYRYRERGGREFSIIRLSEWCLARQDWLLNGWRFLGVDPADEAALQVHEGIERSRLLKRR